MQLHGQQRYWWRKNVLLLSCGRVSGKWWQQLTSFPVDEIQTGHWQCGSQIFIKLQYIQRYSIFRYSTKRSQIWNYLVESNIKYSIHVWNFEHLHTPSFNRSVVPRHHKAEPQQCYFRWTHSGHKSRKSWSHNYQHCVSQRRGEGVNALTALEGHVTPGRSVVYCRCSLQD